MKSSFLTANREFSFIFFFIAPTLATITKSSDVTSPKTKPQTQPDTQPKTQPKYSLSSQNNQKEAQKQTNLSQISHPLYPKKQSTLITIFVTYKINNQCSNKNNPYFLLKELCKGKKVKVKELTTAGYNYFNEYINDSASDGDKILTFVCSLSPLSPESIGQLSFNAKAKYGESLKFNSIASGILSKNSDEGIMLISLLMNERVSSNSSFVNLVCDNNLFTLLSNSENRNSGAINSKTAKTLLASNTSNGLPLLTKAENTAFTSTTNNIAYLPFSNPLYFLANDKFTSSANSLACSSVNLDLDTILLSLANSSNSSFSLFSTANCQFIPDADSSSFSSSGISTFNSAILTSPKKNSENAYLSFSFYSLGNLQNNGIGDAAVRKLKCP